jgi:hypothetical protein
MITDKQFKEELQRRFEKAYKKQLKEAKHHFKCDGWDLCQRSISDAIISDAVGVQLLDQFNSFRMARDLKVELEYKREHGHFVFHDPNYVPVSYNGETNEVVEGVANFNEPWVYLGPL